MSSESSVKTGAPRTARAIARTELTRAILDSARAQVTAVGPAQLSVRAVARDLGMVSSAVYRYFPSRDELLTALIVLCYGELGERAERADAAVVDRADFHGRWMTLAKVTRGWALEHPHDYALLFGSPVPGYAAPTTTIEPATRVTGVLALILHDIHLAGATPAPLGPTTAAEHALLAGLREFSGADLSDELALRGLQAWSGLIGTLTLELFGHYVNAVEDLDTYFDALASRLSPI